MTIASLGAYPNPYASAQVPSSSAMLAKAEARGGVRQAAEEFEAVFLTNMLSQMFAGVPTDGPFGGGHAEQMYRSMLIEQYGSGIAASGGIGLADEIARELLSLQEANNDG
jgi:Rod binding domain-containing protein